MLRELNLCPGKVGGYRAQMGRMLARVLGPLIACAVLLAAPSVASAGPTGSAAGWRDPLKGSMTLTVQALPDPVTRADVVSARATLGPLAVTASFTNGSCSVSCPVRVDLPVDSDERTPAPESRRIVSDGPQTLVVTIRDANGEETEVLRRVITVENNARPSPCELRDLTCKVTVQIGSGSTTPQPSPPDGPVGGDSGPSCASPRLSMRLASKPLRYRHGVPVLAAGKSYRYAGELTCRIDGRRKPAPRGTEVQVRNRLRGWTISKPEITLRKAGDVVAHLSYRSSRVVIFRVRGTGGEVVRVRIPIRVVRVKKGRR
jgi:hypothetical protein